jgi:hypothetical protein
VPRALVAIVALLLASSRARADVDWARGLVAARGIGVADRHAPNPAVARGTSRRRAEDAARASLAEQLAALPLAAGGTAGDRLDARARAALAERAIALAAAPETDGSWRVELVVPIEAVRQAIAGPRTLAPAGDAGAAMIVVDGSGAAPSVGWTANGAPIATIFVAAVPAWAARAPHARGRVTKPGELALDGAAPTASTLIVIVADK